MAYFGAYFQSFHTQDHPNLQSSSAGKRKKKACSGFRNGVEPGAAFGRGESDMKLSPNENVNIGPGMGAPWLWVGGEMPVPPNGIRGPSYRASCTWGRVDVIMNHGGGKANSGGSKPLAVPPAGTINIDPGVGAPFYWEKGEFKVPPNAMSILAMVPEVSIAEKCQRVSTITVETSSGGTKNFSKERLDFKS